MCRLFGLSAGAATVRATYWLLDAPDSLSLQSHREPDGAGLGWFDEHGVAHVDKRPIPAYEDSDFARDAHEVRSANFVAHVRFASTGGLERRNTHPFQQDGRLFAHNGHVEGMVLLEEHLGTDMEIVKGDTDSERVFALITRETTAHAGDLAAGIDSACTWVAENLPLLALNFVLSTSEGLWALRYPDTHPLYVLSCASGEPLEGSSSLGSRVHSVEAGDQRTVVVATERMDEDPRWRLLAPGELVHVTASAHLESRVMLAAPPARQLSLHDLAPAARVSQAPA